MPRPWVKAWTNRLDKAKVLTLPGDLYKVWDLLLLIAERNGRDGLLPAIEDCAFMLHKDEEWLAPKLDELMTRGFIDAGVDGLRMHDWHDWQSSPPSETPDAWRERKRQQRAREQAEQPASGAPQGGVTNVTNVTSGQKMSRPVTGVTIVTTEIREEEKRQEEIREDTTARERVAYPAAFERVYDQFPKHTMKKQALAHWRRLRPNAAMLAAMLAAIARQRESHEWRREEGRYIPSFAAWLAGERWNDELTYDAPPNVVPLRAVAPPPVAEMTPAERAWEAASDDERADGWHRFIARWRSAHEGGEGGEGEVAHGG